MTHETITKAVGIDISALKAINLAATTEETRCYLRGVLLEVEPEHVTYVATNGHILLAYREIIDNELTGKWIIPSEQIKSLNPVGKSFTKALLSVEPQSNDLDMLTINVPGVHQMTFKPVDGVFPDWRRVVPREYDGQTAVFDPRYVSLLQRAGKAMGGTSLPSIAFNGNGPSLMTFGVENLFGVVMPVRSDTPKLPEWMKSELKA